MDDQLVEKFFESIERLDPLDACLPRDIQRVRRRWSEADVSHLPRLLSRLQKALEHPSKTPPDFESVTCKVNFEMVAFLCLEAICAIQRRPAHVPPAVRACLHERDYSLRAKALRYVCRAKCVDGLTITSIKGITQDADGSISNRLYAIWVLWKLKRGNGDG